MTSIRQHARHDSGFTLVETLIVIAIVGTIGIMLAATIVVFARNEGSVSTRLAANRDLQNLTNFLPADVASARVLEKPPLSTPGNACGSGGTISLHIEYQEEWEGDNYSNFITYREFGSPDGRLERFECENGGSPDAVVLARSYDLLAPPTIDIDSATGTVEVVLAFPGAETKRITATSRNFVP